MQHLEEGTIHAWLDGELGAAEAASLESHVSQCTACAALVAEARGLTAASSRILGALDDVPAGVLPEAKAPTRAQLDVVVPAASEAVDLNAHRAARADKAREAAPRRWFNPRYAAAAAVLVMAVGTWSVMQRSATEASFSPMVEATRQDLLVDSTAASSVAAPAVAEPRPADQPAPAKELAKARAAAPLPAAPPPATSGGTGRAERSREERVTAQRDASAANEAPRQLGATAALQRERVDTVKAASDAAAVPAAKRLAVSPDSITASEGRRFRGEQKIALAEVTTTAAGAAAPRPTVTLDKRAFAAGECLSIERSPIAVQLNVPQRVELLDQDGPRIGDRTFKLTRLPMSPPETPRWYWHLSTDLVMTLAQIDGEPPAVRSSVLVSKAAGPGGVRGVPVRCDLR